MLIRDAYNLCDQPATISIIFTELEYCFLNTSPFGDELGLVNG